MPTLEQVKSQLKALDGASQLFGAKEIKALPSVLWEGETIVAGVQGVYNDGFGMLIATDRRLLFVDKKFFGGIKVEDFPYDKVTSIQYETGLLMGSIRIFASGNRADISQVSKSQTQPFAETVRARITAPPQPDVAILATPPDLTAQIERLAALHRNGSLNDSEFSAAKEKLLAP